MSRRCERPGCRELAEVAYGFDSEHAVVWLEAVDPGAIDAVRSGMVCRRHADSMTAPRSWWLDDRRLTSPTLFAAGASAVSGSTGQRRGPARRRQAKSPDLTGELPFPVTDETEHPAPDSSAVGVPAAGVGSGEGSDGDAAPLGQDGRAAVDPDETRALAWSPHFDPSDDLDGLLRASGPLLSRAFGRRPPVGRRTDGPSGDVG